jgi:hypothetical protein
LIFGDQVGKQLEKRLAPVLRWIAPWLLRGLDDMPMEFRGWSQGQRIPAGEALRAPLRNESVYLARKTVLVLRAAAHGGGQRARENCT